MKIVIFFLMTQLFLSITGCSKSEQPGNNSPKSVWKMALLDGKESFTLNPIFYKDIVLYGVKYARLDHNEKPKIIAFSKVSGDKVWEWSDTQSQNETLTISNETYIRGNVLVFTTGARVYALDMNTGKSLWSTKEVEGGGYSVYGVGDKIYHVRSNFDKKKSVLCRANIATGDWTPIFVAEQQNKVAAFGHKMLIKNDNGENHIYLTCLYTNLEYTNSDVYLTKIDVKTDSVTFNKLLPNSDAYSIADIDDRGIYLTGGALKCYSKNTGELLKQYDLPQSRQNYSPGRCIVYGNKLFAPTDFPKLICYDIDSGNILWSEDGLSTSLPSRLIYHDGIIYYTSSSDGFLHAIDENGKRYWKFQSPDRKGSGNGIFDAAISIDAAENRVYVSSYYNAICYETIKK